MTFEEAKKKSVSCVYCMEFPNGKKYVGKTKNLGNKIRLYERYGNGNKDLSGAIDEFGVESTSISVLSEVKCTNRIDLELCLSILEVKYIRELGTTYADNGYNVSFGGEVLGIPIEYLTTDKDAVNAYNTGSKAVLLYDMNGDFRGEYAIKSDALRSFTNSSGVIWGKYHKGYILFKKKDDDYPTKIEPYHVLSKKITKEYYVPADQLEDIPVINNADSFDDVKKVTPRCVDGKYTNIKHQFKVYQYTLGGEFVAEHDSIRDAAHDTGISYAQIYNCLRGATKKAAGFRWSMEAPKNDNAE